MKCPFCSHIKDRVVDSRLSRGGHIIRRRRECLKCKKRFTTYERIEEPFPLVVKRDGRREPFDRMKVIEGMRKACQKRPISISVIEEFVDNLESNLLELGEREVLSTFIGEQVMNMLQDLDEVAYVRFASVYRQFKDPEDFIAELAELLKAKKRKSAKIKTK